MLNQVQYWWVVPIVSFAASLVGAGAAFMGLIWRYRAEFRRDRLGALIADIQSAADLATEYWLIDPSDGSATEASVKASSDEARLLGYAERLEGSIDAARPWLSAIDTLGMEKPWAHFLDKMAGGNFGDPTRVQDQERARDVQYAAAQLIKDLHVATRRRILGENGP